MAIILDQITVGDNLVYSLNEDPRLGSPLGTPALVGTIAMVDVGNAGTYGEAYLKVGAADTAWRLIATATTSQINVEPGTFRYLAVYKTDASGDVVNDDFVETSGGIVSVFVQSHTARVNNMAYRIPAMLNSITAADFVLTEGAQIINGAKTFEDDVIINADLTVNGSITSLDTENTVIKDALITLNKGGGVGSAGGSGIEIEEASAATVAGVLNSPNVTWVATATGTAGNGVTIEVKDTGSGGLQLVSDDGSTVVIDLGGAGPVQMAAINALNGFNSVQMSGSGTVSVAEGPLTLTGGVGDITAFVKINAIRDAWCFKAPTNNYSACLNTQLLTANQNYNFPDQSGTFLLQPATPQGVYKQIAWWQDLNTIVSEVGVAPNALTWDDVNNFLGVQTALPLSILHVGNFTTSGAVGVNSILLGQMNATANIGNGALLAGGIGFPNKAEGLNSLVSGSSSSAQSANSSAMGDGVIASGANAHAEGLDTLASGANAHAEGNGTTATAAASHAEGNGADATAANAHAEGLDTTASAAQAHAEGNTTSASGVNSHAEGLNSSATQPQAHAEGSGTTASADNAHSEGNSTTASGIASHAEGLSTIASGAQAHAEGESTQATAINAHAEGGSTLASAAQAHAEGLSTVASGINAHAEGESTTASGLDSHAGGLSSVADGSYSFAHGRKAQAGGFAGSLSLSDSQDFTSTVDSADRAKLRYQNGIDIVKGGGANDDDGVNYKIRQDFVNTVNATVTSVQTIAIPTDTIVLIESRIVGVRTGGTAGSTGDSASYVRTATYKNIGGTVTVHKRQSDYTFEDQDSWNAVHAVSGTNAVINVNGSANNNVTWNVTSIVQVVKMS
jgi:hypothetical protein